MMKKNLKLLHIGSFRRKVKKRDQKFGRKKSRRIISCLNELSEMEQAGEKDIDQMAGCFGKIMAEIFA